MSPAHKSPAGPRPQPVSGTCRCLPFQSRTHRRPLAARQRDNIQKQARFSTPPQRVECESVFDPAATPAGPRELGCPLAAQLEVLADLDPARHDKERRLLLPGGILPGNGDTRDARLPRGTLVVDPPE